jgi:hypothetical protein
MPEVITPAGADTGFALPASDRAMNHWRESVPPPKKKQPKFTV